MKTNKRYFTGILLFLVLLTQYACHLSDFDLSKLADSKNINPMISAPLAYGKFTINKFVSTTIAPTDPIPASGLSLDPIVLNKTGLSFKTSAIDSVYLVTRVTNPTPAEMKFDLSFFNSTTGTTVGRIFSSTTIPADTTDFPVQFILNPTDQESLANANEIILNFKLFPPSGSTILYKTLSTTTFEVKMSFYAPLNLWKLTN